MRCGFVKGLCRLGAFLAGLFAFTTGAGSATYDRWERGPGGVLLARSHHSAIWTGSEMIVWGGEDSVDRRLDDGAAYNPEDRTWRKLPSYGGPSRPIGYSAIWTGSEMIIWGVGNEDGKLTNLGWKFNPRLNSWTMLSTNNAPSPRGGHAAVWTGHEMIIWGGGDGVDFVDTGGRYDPATDTWRSMQGGGPSYSSASGPAVWTGSDVLICWYFDGRLFSGRYNPATDTWHPVSTNNAPRRSGSRAVWTGKEMLVWGGFASYLDVPWGARYDPASDSWRTMSETNAPTPRELATGVWTGTRMLMWGGRSSWSGDPLFASGGAYDPETDTWEAMPTNNAPAVRGGHSGIWSGTEMIIWGGGLNTGSRFDPARNQWTKTELLDEPGLMDGSAVWTGTELLVWGGKRSDGWVVSLNTGGRYRPDENVWRPMSTNGAPEARSYHTAVWDGTEMLVWGGLTDDYRYPPGARYNPATDTWRELSTNNSPVGRVGHSAFWTGTEMIIWGGRQGGQASFDSGARYDPKTDQWVAMRTADELGPRGQPISVWTGREMIVWGGFSENLGFFVRSGARYDPQTDRWQSMNSIGAPSSSGSHVAVWTGREMVVWGELSNDRVTRLGRAYDPVNDTWRRISTNNAPSTPSGSGAVWSGTEMIVWGTDTFILAGGKYNPEADAWSAMQTNGAPHHGFSGRRPLLVWAENQVLVFGATQHARRDPIYKYLLDVPMVEAMGTSGTEFSAVSDTVSLPGSRRIRCLWNGPNQLYRLAWDKPTEIHKVEAQPPFLIIDY